LAGKGDDIVAQVDKDDFNLDDFQYSGVKLPRPAEITEEAAAAVAEPMQSIEAAPIASAASSEEILPIESEADEPVAKKKNKAGLFQKLATTNPYLVLLGMTLIALFLAVIFLAVELLRYDLDIHATQGKQALTMNDSITPPFSGYYCLTESEKASLGPSEIARSNLEPVA
jgi:hypothetical protein